MKIIYSKMIPFYCVVQKVCKKCENIDFKKDKIYLFEKQDEFDCCGMHEFFFEENSETKIVDALCEFILSQENSVWIAHNGGRFDTIFIFKYLLEKKKISPNTIMHGYDVTYSGRKYLLF